MDEDASSPPEMSSFQAIKALYGNISDLNKKRKLEVEQLDLPSAKHKCWDQGCSTPVLAPCENKTPEIESVDLPRNKFFEKRDKRSSYEEPESQFESAKGSNSFTEDADSEMSVHDETSLETKYEKFNDRPSTSSANQEFPVSQDNKNHLDGLTVSHHGEDKGKSIVGIEEHRSEYIDEEPQFSETLEEHLLEFGCHLGYTCSEYGNDCSQQCAAKEEDEFFGLIRGNYVLSSGQLSMNEETQSAPRKPTIDQEFEEYFSSLMM
ncbi:protein FAR-RED ELONGATED HYPOCOTYL 1 isoform X1 [Punica granatum]|uniref:Protein FAR-RED ELONGATED HYPOCOTYL 1 isoform X1 n=2 Tax=Punica granatum TaxID=22663 RepID=A0A6P8DN50_PUNGR|nr:protein FAR-RED ELONGATED HYPOCOTYL 1 isoform X1 [Punica granatum]PKI39361.1 hypothetical protein CRG98_040227 [Punica granatum]